MAQFLSDQETKMAAQPAGNNLLDPRDLVGRQRIAYFTYTVPASSGPQIADTLLLTRLPANARLIAGKLIVAAFGTSATLSIGYAGATTRYLSGADVSAAATILFLNTAAQNYGDELAVMQDIMITFAGAAPAAGALSGHITYVLD